MVAVTRVEHASVTATRAIRGPTNDIDRQSCGASALLTLYLGRIWSALTSNTRHFIVEVARFTFAVTGPPSIPTLLAHIALSTQALPIAPRVRANLRKRTRPPIVTYLGRLVIWSNEALLLPLVVEYHPLAKNLHSRIYFCCCDAGNIHLASRYVDLYHIAPASHVWLLCHLLEYA